MIGAKLVSTKSTGRVLALGMSVGAASALLLFGFGPALAGCLVPPAKLSDSAMQAFRDRPGDLLQRHPTGGPIMSAEIMRHVGSDESVLPSIIQLGKDANRAQRVAIGIGLARAAAACTRAQPELEKVIMGAVTAAGISELATAFAAGLASLETFRDAAIGAEAQLGGVPLSGGLSAAPGGSTRGAGAGGPGGGGGGGSPTEFLTFGVRGSATVRGGGRPVTSVRGGGPLEDDAQDTGTPVGRDPEEPRDPGGGTVPDGSPGAAPVSQVVTSGGGLIFSSKGVTSTYGATVSPTRR